LGLVLITVSEAEAIVGEVKVTEFFWELKAESFFREGNQSLPEAGAPR
jgi:hypothetical protein